MPTRKNLFTPKANLPDGYPPQNKTLREIWERDEAFRVYWHTHSDGGKRECVEVKQEDEK